MVFGFLFGNVCSQVKNCPAGCASATNVAYGDDDVFATTTVSLYHTL
jgi:hypothetical protein